MEQNECILLLMPEYTISIDDLTPELVSTLTKEVLDQMTRK